MTLLDAVWASTTLQDYTWTWSKTGGTYDAVVVDALLSHKQITL